MRVTRSALEARATREELLQMKHDPLRVAHPAQVAVEPFEVKECGDGDGAEDDESERVAADNRPIAHSAPMGTRVWMSRVRLSLPGVEGGDLVPPSYPAHPGRPTFPHLVRLALPLEVGFGNASVGVRFSLLTRERGVRG
jgi:hypothetical protein